PQDTDHRKLDMAALAPVAGVSRRHRVLRCRVGPPALEGGAVSTLVLLACACFCAADAEPRASVVVVVGAGGTEEYGGQFRLWAERWQEAAARGNAETTMIGLDGLAETTDRERLQTRLAGIAGPSSEPLWLVLIGHGTFDGKTARFNL